MLGILADVNIIGQVEFLVQRMQSKEWADYWQSLGLTLKQFADVGLTTTSTDLEIWQACQAQQLVLITDNRNQDSDDSMETTIRRYNNAESLPIFTISDIVEFGESRTYFERVLEELYGYLERIDEVRGTGRLFLP